jgi:hypothetical protein
LAAGALMREREARIRTRVLRRVAPPGVPG